MRITVGCSTNPGNTHPVNQDAIFVRSMEQNGQYFALGAVCDGIGGLERGEWASGFLLSELRNWYRGVKGWIDIANVNQEIIFSHLKDAVEEWNRDLYDRAAEMNLRTGSTMVIILILRDRYHILNVGDSRVYRYCSRTGITEQLTVDANVTRLKDGRMKLYLNNCMGKAHGLWFQSVSGAVRPDDMFVICSDGFYRRIMYDDIKTAYKYAKKGKHSEVCDCLIQKIISRGEKDNISVGILYADNCRKKLFGRKSGNDM